MLIIQYFCQFASAMAFNQETFEYITKSAYGIFDADFFYQ